MFEVNQNDSAEKNYINMVKAIKELLKTEKDIIANLSNISSFIQAYMADLNWAGFYILKDGELVLGPFQGRPACIRIKLGKGVCGTAAEEKRIMMVDNVHEFSGHIACDSETNSEIVLPIYQNDKVFGVLDLDSPKLKRFSPIEKKYLSEISNAISEFLSNQV